MADLFAISERIIDSGVLSEPSNRVTSELSEVIDGVAVVESFSHVWSVDTGDGLVLFDASSVHTGEEVVEALRSWRQDRVDTLIYTHGHVDHVGGSGFVMADGERRGHERPAVVAHEAVAHRFDRYRRTNGWNLRINARQFGGVRSPGLRIEGDDNQRFLPDATAEPTETYSDRTQRLVGDTTMELFHARGETDDHTWTWLPERRAIFSGDLIIWTFPNAGNPQKVQRHPGEWATALRAMSDLKPEYLFPAHGLPIAGEHRVGHVLDNTADALEHLVRVTVDLMNDGSDLDSIIHSVKVPDHLAELPYLQALYDEPEFVIRNIWRLYGGWWDGDPATLKPAPRRALAAELTIMAGGSNALIDRACALVAESDYRMACHLVEIAADADPTNRDVHQARVDIYGARRRHETSLMAKGVFAGAVRKSQKVVDG